MKLGTSSLEVPSIAVGCMRLNALEPKELMEYVSRCMEMGLYFFDHADIYGNGECEERFACAVKEAGIRREDMILQSKCGIRPDKGTYDLSKQHILESVEGILKRLDTDYLDVLALHRPDTLVDPEEVASAFDLLQQSGKVRYFGVSNHRPAQIALLSRYIKQELIVNQLQFSLPCSNMIASELEANMLTEGSIDHDGGILGYCRLNDITIQAWSPFQYGFFEGVYLDNDKFPELNKVLSELSEAYHVPKSAIATSWILTHPAKIQMIAGTTNIDRLEDITKGINITLTKEEWYKLYKSAGHILP